MNIWTRYVILKAKNQTEAQVILDQIEERLGIEVRQQVEAELIAMNHPFAPASN